MAEDSRRRQSTDSIISPIEGMESVVATVTGYVGIERFNLIKLISRCGGNYVGYMNKTITHLVCWKYEGRKYELAWKFKTKVVNHQWVEDCIKKGRRIPEYPYTLQCGQEVGPLLLNISINNDQEKRHSTLPESSSKRRKRKLVKKETREILEIPSDSEQNDHRVSDFQENTAAFLNNSDAKRHEPLYDSTCGENRSGKTEFLNDLEPIQDVDGVFNSDQTPRLMGTTASHVKDAVTNVNCTGGIASSPASTGWSCVICMEFSAIRGVLMCGHRFCYACIKTWADRKNASGKDSTCPICKTIFKEIIEVEDAAYSDQKTYTQTIPNDDIRRVHIVPDVLARSVRSNLQEPHVCLECNCREPADLLIDCHICQRYSIHHFCLDPPIYPWACSGCRGLRRLLSN